jgi:hypothetical protein
MLDMDFGRCGRPPTPNTSSSSSLDKSRLLFPTQEVLGREEIFVPNLAA